MLRRYAPMKASRGTVIPPALRIEVIARDGGCVGFQRFPGDCMGALEIDHVRASGGVGMKSRTEADNLVALCGSHHRWKTEHGRTARPLLIEYLEGVTHA
jgi:5-methylcytosine-specific restriction endonuclease McrA